ncbi:MAG: DUF6036 family nucleotidyltransferase [Amphritea sp.]
MFGGAAVHIYTNARGSSDIDVEHIAAEQLDFADIVITYTDSDGQEKSITVDPTFNSTFGLLHEDYEDDAIPLKATEGTPLEVYLVSALDIAVSKLARMAEIDQTDIIDLAKAGRFSIDEFTVRATEAISYAVANQQTLLSHLSFMENKLREELESE